MGEGNEIAWGKYKNLEFERLKEMCSVASRKWDVSSVTPHELDIRYVVLLDGRSYRMFVAQLLVQQHPTAEALVQAPGGQNTYPYCFS